MKEKVKNKLAYILGFISIFIIWYLGSFMFGNQNFFPYPHQVLGRVFNLLLKIKTYQNIYFTLSRTLLGFLISLLVAIILGLIAYIYPTFESYLKPIIAAIRSIPNVTLIFIIFLFFFNSNSIHLLIFFIAFPLLYQSVIGGLKNITKELINVYRIESSNYFKGTFKIFLPLAFPYIFIGILSTFGLSLKVEIMSEILIGNTRMHGIGREIYYSFNRDFDYLNLFAWTLITILVLLILESIINIFKKSGS